MLRPLLDRSVIVSPPVLAPGVRGGRLLCFRTLEVLDPREQARILELEGLYVGRTVLLRCVA